jgi:hypothetical protein
MATNALKKTDTAGAQGKPATDNNPKDGDPGKQNINSGAANTAALAGVGTNFGTNATMVAAAQTQAAADMAATIALAAIARQVALVEAFAQLMKKGGDALKAGI